MHVILVHVCVNMCVCAHACVCVYASNGTHVVVARVRAYTHTHKTHKHIYMCVCINLVPALHGHSLLVTRIPRELGAVEAHPTHAARIVRVL